jgi:hypothetical protein
VSNISNRHIINAFVSGKSEPLSGQRLAKVGYKSSKANPAKFPSICVSVPQIDPAPVLENINRLLPFIGTMLENAQDGIIRSLYESADGSLSGVNDDEISIDACIAFMSAEASGGRLTIEFLNGWFDQNVKDNLTVVVADKLGFDLSTPEMEQTVGKHVKVYRDLIASLSGGKTILTSVQIVGIRRALEVSSVDDDTSSKLLARLTAMENKPKIEDLLAL